MPCVELIDTNITQTIAPLQNPSSHTEILVDIAVPLFSETISNMKNPLSLRDVCIFASSMFSSSVFNAQQSKDMSVTISKDSLKLISR